MQIEVNGRSIPEHVINREAQYHPAAHWAAAQHEAARALVVRELLLAEAKSRGLASDAELDERDADDAIRQLTEDCIPVPPVSDEDCQAYYEANPQRFAGPPLFEASHILIATGGSDASDEAEARAKAQALLRDVLDQPRRFEQIAKSQSACPSASNGGRLGQISSGETHPEFEASLKTLQPGSLSQELVKTRHGFHIVRLDHRAESSRVPFPVVRDKIRIYLRDARWRRSLQQFVDSLAATARIDGFDLSAPAPDAPVQPAASPTDQTSTTQAAALGTASQPESVRRLPVLLG